MKKPTYLLNRDEMASIYCEYKDGEVTSIKREGSDLAIMVLLRDLIIGIIEEQSEDLDDFCIELKKYQYYLENIEEFSEFFNDDRLDEDGYDKIRAILTEKFGESSHL